EKCAVSDHDRLGRSSWRDDSTEIGDIPIQKLDANPISPCCDRPVVSSGAPDDVDTAGDRAKIDNGAGAAAGDDPHSFPDAGDRRPGGVGYHPAGPQINPEPQPASPALRDRPVVLD